MTHRLSLLLTLLAASLPLRMASAQTPPAPRADEQPASTPVVPKPPPATAGMARASEVMGKSIVDATGITVGRIRNLVAQGSNRLVAIVQRSDGSFVGLPLVQLMPVKANRSPAPSDSDAAVATGAPSATLEIDRFMLAGDAQIIATAPPLADPAHVDSAWLDTVHRQFGTMLISPHDMDATNAPGGNALGPAAPAPEPILLGDLITAGVTDGSGQAVGRVRDVALELPGGLASFAVLADSASPSGAEVLHGISMESLQPGGAAGGFVLQGVAPTLSAAPGIDLGRLPSAPDLSTPTGVAPHGNQPARPNSAPAPGTSAPTRGNQPKGNEPAPKPAGAPK